MIPQSTISLQESRTPAWLRKVLLDRFRFTLDAAATADNALCKRFYSPDQDALSLRWCGVRIFCNPPYGRAGGGIGAWLQKGATAFSSGKASLVVYLLPANTGTSWFRDFAPHCDVEFLTPRVAFEDNEGVSRTSPPHASMLMIFGRGLDANHGVPFRASIWEARP